MENGPEMQEVYGLSPDPHVRVFRRTLDGLEDFEGMVVDAYVVLGEQYAVVLDTLLCPEDARQMIDAIAPGLSERDLLCVNSHADWDHTWGNGYFSESISIVAHEACRLRMLSERARAELAEYQARYPVFQEVFLQPPTLTFCERFRIHDPAWTIELLHAPGHCQDQIVAWLPESRLLLAFDAVEKPLPSIENAACVPLMFSTLEFLLTLDARTVLCSHGNTSSPALIKENLAYLREVERRARLLLTQHTPTEAELEQAAQLIHYPFEEVIAHIDEEVDRTYYGWAHNANARALLQWLMDS